MKKILNIGLLLVVSLLLAACGGTKVMNIDNSNFTAESKVSSYQVEKAIKKGASRKGWSTRKTAKGTLEARNNVRGKHLVVVEIKYNSKGYRINYKDSQNMKYDASANTIHGNYNKWVSNLERNINYELNLIGVNTGASSSSTSRNVTYLEPKKATASSNKNYKYAGNINVDGKTIYLKRTIPFSSTSNVATNIKVECTIDSQLAEFIKSSAAAQGLNVVFKDNPKSTDLFLDVQITKAVSSGGAFRGHNKYVTISGDLVKGKRSYGNFKAARISGGGFWGAYKSSCAVLGRTVKTLGNDVGTWLVSPNRNARLGDTQLIP